MIDKSLLKRGLAVYCSTPEECREFLTGMYGLGYTWFSGSSLLRNNSMFFDRVWKGNGTFHINDKTRIKYTGAHVPGSVPFSEILRSPTFTPAPEADFLSLLGGFSESEVSSHA